MRASESPETTVYSFVCVRKVGNSAGELGVGVGPEGAGVIVTLGSSVAALIACVLKRVGVALMGKPWGTCQGS